MADRLSVPPDDVVLSVENLRTEFHLRRGSVGAVDGVSFAVRAGECVGLVGESGCGKSTVGLSIMKLLPANGHVTGGSVRILGRDVVPLSDKEMQKLRGNEVSMIFQDPMTSLNPTWTIGRQIAEPVMLHRGQTAKQARERALEVLTLVGMPRPAERLDYYPHQLSGGLRQRVMIAMALACEPKLLIADEPTTALDATVQAQLMELLGAMQQELGMALIIITHDLGLVASVADQVLVMYAGRAAEKADTTSLFYSAHHPYTRGLLGSIPGATGAGGRLVPIQGNPPSLINLPRGCAFHPRCEFAMDVCVREQPDLAPVKGGPGHESACWLPPEMVGVAPAVDDARRRHAARRGRASLGRPAPDAQTVGGAATHD